ncbi:MAG: VPLPA-CTERM sorting domain-containing protein [Steroidobacteraceae bacterium]
MKLSITPVAVAVTMALGVAVAQAQIEPTFGSTNPADGGSNDGLYLAVWDNTSNETDLVDLTAIYKQVSLTKSTSMVTPTPGSNGWTTVSNFDGFASVDQLNLGTISNWSTVFPSGGTGTTFFAVVAGNNQGQQDLSSAALNNINPVTPTAIHDYDAAILGESANWASASSGSPLADLTPGTAAYSAVNGPLKDGSEGLTGANFGVQVGTAAGFYSYVSNQLAGTSSVTPYTYNGQQGFWLLSTAGDLTWNLVASNATTPLPAAVWLFASGLIGLGLIGRRRREGLGAAV